VFSDTIGGGSVFSIVKLFEQHLFAASNLLVFPRMGSLLRLPPRA
jgi:hypothetical protein